MTTTSPITGWQLGLRGAEAGWDVLSDLLAARGAEVDHDPTKACSSRPSKARPI